MSHKHAPGLVASCCWRKEVRPREGYACDIVDQPDVRPEWKFEIQDVRYLSYPDEFFDVVIASLVLIWFDEVDVAIIGVNQRWTRKLEKQLGEVLQERSDLRFCAGQVSGELVVS